MTEENFKVPGWLLSTGTLRILALLACLRHPYPPPLLVVEEIENGLDPRTIHLLVEEFRAAIAAKKTQILVTTHSPYLLDLLDLSHIVVVERVEEATRFPASRQGAARRVVEILLARAALHHGPTDQGTVMPRVGILVECGPEGLEFHVCRKICALLQRDTRIVIEPEIIPMGNKLRLIEDCAATTRSLFNRGCERVVILWDERPAWPEMKEPLCWHHERARILEGLQRANLANRPVSLVCIEREFESWLLHDHQLLSALLSRRRRESGSPGRSIPIACPTPKAR